MSTSASSSFLTSLFSSLAEFEPTSKEPVTKQGPGFDFELPFNLFLSSPEATNFFKPKLTVLHLFFPNELLPALDLLDRGLISRLVYPTDVKEEISSGKDDTPASFYIVRSSASVHRGPQYTPNRAEQEDRWQSKARNLTYEVRLVAWNCTCPAFSFDMVSCLSGINEQERDTRTHTARTKAEADAGWVYGGRRISHQPIDAENKVPICKHLLACLLVERCPLLRQFVEEREVSEEEAAGWAAGWGD